MSNIRYIFKSDGTSNDLRFNTSPSALCSWGGAAHLFGRDSQRWKGEGCVRLSLPYPHPPFLQVSSVVITAICMTGLSPRSASAVMERGMQLSFSPHPPLLVINSRLADAVVWWWWLFLSPRGVCGRMTDVKKSPSSVCAEGRTRGAGGSDDFSVRRCGCCCKQVG